MRNEAQQAADELGKTRLDELMAKYAPEIDNPLGGFWARRWSDRGKLLIIVPRLLARIAELERKP
jgi:hypothetical protein